MPPPASTSAFAFARPWAATIALVLAVTLLRLTYLAFLCPYTLIEDEAHYWEWSRRLDLSYYTKGPGIAWTIAGGTSIAGDTEFGVRLASPIASAILCLAVAALARLMTSDTRSARDGRVAFFAVVALLLAPVFQTMGLMLTIDGPYAACWALAALFGWLAIHRRFRTAWIALGLAIGIGFLYKYTILLMIPGLALFAIFSHLTRTQHQPDLEPDAAPRRDAFPSLIQSLTRSTWPWVVAGLIALLIAIAPVLLWNAREGWPTIRHLLGHLGLAGGDMPVHSGTATDPKPGYSILWTLSLIGTQIAMIGPAILLIIPAVVAARRERDMSPDAATWHRGVQYCLCIGTPVLLFYIGVSFIAEPEGNWPLAAWITIFPLIGHAVVRGWPAWREKLEAWRALPEPRPRAGLFVRRPETFTQVVWTWALIVGGLVALLTPRLDLLASTLGLVPSSILPNAQRLIPIHRFTGADRMGQHAQQLLDQLATESAAASSNTASPPFVMAMHYGRASQLAFYMPSRPSVVCSSSIMLGGRVTQYDYWPDTTPKDRTDLLGRNALVVGAWQEVWEQAFERVVPAGRLEGDGKRDRPAFLAYGFKGFPPDGITRDSVPPPPEWPPLP
jgi:hypothetical protein